MKSTLFSLALFSALSIVHTANADTVTEMIAVEKIEQIKARLSQCEVKDTFGISYLKPECQGLVFAGPIEADSTFLAVPDMQLEFQIINRNLDTRDGCTLRVKNTLSGRSISIYMYEPGNAVSATIHLLSEYGTP